MRFASALLSTTVVMLAGCPDRGGDSGTGTDTAATTGTSTGGTATTGDATSNPTTGSTALTGDEAVPCEGAVPPDGSGPCAVEGEDCKFEDDLCTPFVGAKCQGGVWVHYENTPGPECGESACDPPNFPTEGTACAEEGASCSTDCSDQCSFCNAWTCEDGVWQHLEVFPAPCLQCEALCEFVIVPMCPGGPPDTATCVSGCEDNKVGRCKVEFSNLRACAGSEPTFTCDMSGRPQVDACAAQFAAFYACLMP